MVSTNKSVAYFSDIETAEIYRDLFIKKIKDKIVNKRSLPTNLHELYDNIVYDIITGLTEMRTVIVTQTCAPENYYVNKDDINNPGSVISNTIQVEKPKRNPDMLPLTNDFLPVKTNYKLGGRITFVNEQEELIEQEETIIPKRINFSEISFFDTKE